MRQVEYGDGADRVVFVLGWGNRPEHDGVRWLIDNLTDDGYAVTAFELPRTITDFESEYLAPVQRHLDGLDSYRLLSHSTGGLISRYVDRDERMETRTYLSPWWGFHPDLENPLVALLMKVPLPKPILPANAEKHELGELATDEWVDDAPDYAAPTFLREARQAQQTIPPFDDRDAVFYNPEDPIVGTDAIEAQAPAENRIRFEGGHELFNSRSREDHIDAVLAAVDGGIAAVRE